MLLSDFLRKNICESIISSGGPGLIPTPGFLPIKPQSCCHLGPTSASGIVRKKTMRQAASQEAVVSDVEDSNLQPGEGGPCENLSSVRVVQQELESFHSRPVPSFWLDGCATKTKVFLRLT